jgi:hypothetical protein
LTFLIGHFDVIAQIPIANSAPADHARLLGRGAAASAEAVLEMKNENCPMTNGKWLFLWFELEKH